MKVVCIVVIGNEFNKLENACCFGWFFTSDIRCAVALENLFISCTFLFMVVLPGFSVQHIGFWISFVLKFNFFSV